MITDAIAAQAVATHNADLARALACLADAEALQQRMRGVEHLLDGRRLQMPSEQSVHRASLEALVGWYGDNAVPGYPINLSPRDVFTAMKVPSSYRSGFDLSAVTIASLMVFLRHTYGPQAKDRARAALRVRLEQSLWLNRTREERGTLVLHIHARSEATYGGTQRALEWSARETLQRASDEVTRAITFEGLELPAQPNALTGDALTRALTTEFRYRAKLPIAIGHLVLFKDFVELVLDPALAPVFALFLSSFDTERDAA